MICGMMGADFSKVVTVTEDRPGKDAAYLLDSAKARAAFGWTDRVPLEAGIRDTITWVDRHFDELRQQPLDYVHKA